ncbi:CoA transferase [Mycolicibacterium smegmatis]|nr:CoA transferase [Mycolicibacterium smegmatis]MCP2622184.1 CoA transferase [Mycolicibacterium smegmatis]MCP2622639.1 CoA transferase [Mycolicibacterium smegmatis]UGU34680.1 CoA transferase [Mycolicibacterium smegmatis]ULN38477.1 CoA transferase [Mycolicibacterium smegmatis]ULN73380.1 CoA transferase [Mycolicibacterium smegmatis]
MGISGISEAVAARAQHVADAFTGVTGVAVDARVLLTGRAAMLGLRPRGRISAGGATHLFPSFDGRWCALTLSRPDDVAAVPALVQADTVDADPWPVVETWAAATEAHAITERARLLGLPAAVLGETVPAAPRITRMWPRGTGRPLTGLLVADLSSMWAGPLCGQLLRQAGATVVKVESHARPDGTRNGPQVFFDWMNHGKLSYVADFGEPSALGALLDVADVVIESSRPTALVRRGLGPDVVASREGRVWVRITGHGTTGEHADWVAFGDDAAVSGGLVKNHHGTPSFAGDAIADPLTGLHAAHAVAESLTRGGGDLIEFAMSAVAATYADLATTGADIATVEPASAPAGPALGADNGAVTRLIAGSRPC